MPNPFVLITPGATRGLSLALTRQFLRTTNLPVYASHRREASDDEISRLVFEPADMKCIDPKRLSLLRLNLTSETSIKRAADTLAQALKSKPDSYIHTAFITGGILYPEKQPADLDVDHMKETFEINAISHLLIIKHFSRFLPSQKLDIDLPAKWAHITARVGSIDDNKRGGWYSYRSSKAALNQIIKTFDLHLQQQKKHALCVGVHPGTVKTDLSKSFWNSVSGDGVFEATDAAENLINVVKNLRSEQRGQVWDWAGQRVPW